MIDIRFIKLSNDSLTVIARDGSVTSFVIDEHNFMKLEEQLNKFRIIWATRKLRNSLIHWNRRDQVRRRHRNSELKERPSYFKRVFLYSAKSIYFSNTVTIEYIY